MTEVLLAVGTRKGLFIGRRRGGTWEFDESPYARQVATLYGTEHHEFDLTPNLVEALPRIAWHADEPFAISSARNALCTLVSFTAVCIYSRDKKGRESDRYSRPSV